MLGGQLVIRADNGALEQAPDTLNGIRVNIAAHPLFFAMLYCLVARVRVLYTK